MGETIKCYSCYLKGKTCSKLANRLNIYDSETEIDPSGYSDPVPGLYTSHVYSQYIYVGWDLSS